MNAEIDTGKIMALYMAGWTDFDIGLEMGLSTKEVREAIYAVIDKQREQDRIAFEKGMKDGFNN